MKKVLLTISCFTSLGIIISGDLELQKTESLKNNGITRTLYFDNKGKVEKIGYQPEYNHIFEICWYYYNIKTGKYSKLDPINAMQVLPDGTEYDALEKTFLKESTQSDDSQPEKVSESTNWCSIL